MSTPRSASGPALRSTWLSLFTFAAALTLGSGCHLIDDLGLDDPGNYHGDDEWPGDPGKPDDIGGPNCHRSEVPPPPPGGDSGRCPEPGSRCADSTPVWCDLGGRRAVLVCTDGKWDAAAVEGEVICDDAPPAPGPERK